MLATSSCDVTMIVLLDSCESIEYCLLHLPCSVQGGLCGGCVATRLKSCLLLFSRPGGMGNMPMGGMATATNGGKRMHDEAISAEPKRQKVSVQPPPQERLPDQGSMDLGDLQKRFEQLKEEVRGGGGGQGGVRNHR
jgi:hypothetical protein